MTWLNPAAIDGALLEAKVLRTLAFAAVGDGEGIVAKNDLKVTATAGVEDNRVHVASGGAVILNRYPNGTGEAYAAYNKGTDSVVVPDTAGASRTDLIVARINDPEFDTQPPSGQEDTWPYAETEVITGVPAGTTDASTLNLGYPAVALARITRGATTGIVTSGQITDLRKLARPKQRPYASHIPSPGTNGLNTVSPSWENFPAAGQFQVEIPEWATRATIWGFVEGLRHTKAGQGNIRIVLVETGVGTELTNINESTSTSGVDRVGYNVGGEIPLPASVRGTTVTFRFQGRVTATVDQGFLALDTHSSVMLNALLEEKPD